MSSSHPQEWAADLRVVLLNSAPGGRRVPHPRLGQHHMEVRFVFCLFCFILLGCMYINAASGCTCTGTHAEMHAHLSNTHKTQQQVLYLRRHTLNALGKALGLLIDGGDGHGDDADALLSPLPDRGRLRRELKLSERCVRTLRGLEDRPFIHFVCVA